MLENLFQLNGKHKSCEELDEFFFFPHSLDEKYQTSNPNAYLNTDQIKRFSKSVNLSVQFIVDLISILSPINSGLVFNVLVFQSGNFIT